MPKIGTFFGGIAPALLGAGLVIFEMAYSQSLLSPAINILTALQFGCSLWFGAGVTYLYTEATFLEKQKKFAISAYRRINEIERNVKRLLSRMTNEDPRKTANELQIVQEVLLSLQVTISSSKADWADVIGEEIRTLEEFLKLRVGEETPDPEREAKAADLLSELPATLEIEAREGLHSSERIFFGAEQLREEFVQQGFVLFNCFWDSSFPRDIDSLSVGDTVRIEVNDVNTRIGGLIVHGVDGTPIGVVTNKGLGSNTYREFAEMVIDAFGSRFAATYIHRLQSTERDDDEGTKERHYFAITSSDLRKITAD